MSYECPRCGCDVWDDCANCRKDARIAALEAERDRAVLDAAAQRLYAHKAEARIAAVLALCDQMRDEGWAWEYAEPKLRATATGDEK